MFIVNRGEKFSNFQISVPRCTGEACVRSRINFITVSHVKITLTGLLDVDGPFSHVAATMNDDIRCCS